jgi:pimeloyl-ACP methyl ester carboxylesterase
MAANVVLVHGADADGSCWSKVIPILQDAGHSVVAVQLPLTSIADDAATARRAIDKFDAPVVVVGHSFGGVVITQAAHNASNVSALVYIAAFAPDASESAADLVGRFPALESGKYIVVDKNGFFAFPQDQFPRLFAQDVDPIEARVLAVVQGPADAARFPFKSGPPAWREHPSWYLVAEADGIINPDLERWMAQRIDAKTTSVPGASHAVMVSRPREVANVILAAASAAPVPAGARARS